MLHMCFDDIFQTSDGNNELEIEFRCAKASDNDDLTAVSYSQDLENKR